MDFYKLINFQLLYTSGIKIVLMIVPGTSLCALILK